MSPRALLAVAGSLLAAASMVQSVAIPKSAAPLTPVTAPWNGSVTLPNTTSVVPPSTNGTSLPWVNSSLPASTLLSWPAYLNASLPAGASHNMSAWPPAQDLRWLNGTWLNATFPQVCNISFPVVGNGSLVAGSYESWVQQNVVLFYGNNTSAALLSQWLWHARGLNATSPAEWLGACQSWLLSSAPLQLPSTAAVCGSSDAPVPPTANTWGGTWYLAKDYYTVKTDTSIASYLTYTDNFSVLGGLIGNYSDLMAALSAPGAVMFAPQNDAFAALNASVLDALTQPSASPALHELLAYHVLGRGANFTSLSALPKDSRVCVDTAAASPLQLYASSTSSLSYANDAIVVGQVNAANGVLYVIQQVLSPLFFANETVNNLVLPNATASMPNVTSLLSGVEAAQNSTNSSVGSLLRLAPWLLSSPLFSL